MGKTTRSWTLCWPLQLIWKCFLSGFLTQEYGEIWSIFFSLDPPMALRPLIILLIFHWQTLQSGLLTHEFNKKKEFVHSSCRKALIPPLWILTVLHLWFDGGTGQPCSWLWALSHWFLVWKAGRGDFSAKTQCMPSEEMEQFHINRGPWLSTPEHDYVTTHTR